MLRMDGRWQPIRSLDSPRSLIDISPPADAPDVAQAMQTFETSLISIGQLKPAESNL